jgi:hypothetical protein
MKRDCGNGELIPIRQFILYSIGMSDEKHKERDVTRWDNILNNLPPFSIIRLYAEDKQGYCNCIYSIRIDAYKERITCTDRRSEL